jgi:3',5'-cyclic AMP phosphodiesterase CpdA
MVIETPSRVIVHLSDLHFGRADPAVVSALRDAVRAIEPDIVAISGDLTQRARRSQFRRAKAFIDELPSPQVVVPGNHDVPLFNVVARLANPLGGYRRFVTPDLSPTFTDEVLWVTGIDTTRPATWKSGRVDAATLHRIEMALADVPGGTVKVVVAHHPFDATDGTGATPSLHTLTGAGIDVFLTGHLHTSYAGHTAQRYRTGGRSAVVVEAATATSTRLRQEANGFNVLRVTTATIHVEAHSWNGRTFVRRDRQAFSRSDGGWTGG